MASAGALWVLVLPINLTLPLFNVARRPRPAPRIRLTMSKPVAPIENQWEIAVRKQLFPCKSAEWVDLFYSLGSCCQIKCLSSVNYHLTLRVLRSLWQSFCVCIEWATLWQYRQIARLAINLTFTLTVSWCMVIPAVILKGHICFALITLFCMFLTLLPA